MVAVKVTRPNYRILVLSNDLTFDGQDWSDMCQYVYTPDEAIEALQEDHRWNQVWFDGNEDHRKVVEWIDAMCYGGNAPDIGLIYIQADDFEKMEWMNTTLVKNYRVTVCKNPCLTSQTASSAGS